MIQDSTDPKVAVMHEYLRSKYGRPPVCQFCGKKGELVKTKFNDVWSIQYAKKRNKIYSRNVKDYLNLCSKCHKNYDLIDKRKRKAIEMEKKLNPANNPLMIL